MSLNGNNNESIVGKQVEKMKEKRNEMKWKSKEKWNEKSLFLFHSSLNSNLSD